MTTNPEQTATPLSGDDIAQVRKYASSDWRKTMLDLCDTIDSLRGRVEELEDSEQGWVDRSAYYRNVAIEAGATPEKFDDDYDRALARDETLCCPCEAEARADLAEARRQRDERPAGRVLAREITYQYEGYDNRGWSFINPGSLDVPPGTEVAVVVLADDSGERCPKCEGRIHGGVHESEFSPCVLADNPEEE